MLISQAVTVLHNKGLNALFAFFINYLPVTIMLQVNVILCQFIITKVTTINIGGFRRCHQCPRPFPNPNFERPSAFYGHFMLKIPVALQNKFHCITLNIVLGGSIKEVLPGHVLFGRPCLFVCTLSGKNSRR